MISKVSSDQKAELLRVLRAFIGEWGPESIVVSVPRNWERFGPDSLGPVSLVYAGDDSIVIGVEHATARLTYRMMLGVGVS